MELQPWLSIKAPTEGEQMYVDAVQAMYQDYAPVSRDETRGSYLSIMRQLRAKYLDDINASLFYGLGLIWTADQASGDHINGEKQ